MYPRRLPVSDEEILGVGAIRACEIKIVPQRCRHRPKPIPIKRSVDLRRRRQGRRSSVKRLAAGVKHVPALQIGYRAGTAEVGNLEAFEFEVLRMAEGFDPSLGARRFDRVSGAG